jgi:hypothetical protein
MAGEEVLAELEQPAAALVDVKALVGGHAGRHLSS